MRNISFALTTEQVRNRTKNETRRNGWEWLVAACERGDTTILRGVVKGMGLKKGEHPERITCIRVEKAWREPLSAITADAVIREGFPDKSPGWFAHMYCDHNGGSLHQFITAIQFSYPFHVHPANTKGDFGIMWADNETALRESLNSKYPAALQPFNLTPITSDIE